MSRNVDNGLTWKRWVLYAVQRVAVRIRVRVIIRVGLNRFVEEHDRCCGGIKSG